MKKRLIFLAMLVLMVSSVAFSIGWDAVPELEPTKYSISIDKYERHVSDIGTAFSLNPNVMASRGETVFYVVNAYDANGNPVEVSLEYHDLTSVVANGNMYTAKVTGSNPYVRAYITEKTDLTELYFNGERIIVDGNIVTIGGLVFARENGVVVDVTYNGNALEMKNALAKLNMTIEEIYTRQIHMTDDILIANFGKVSHSEAVASWGAKTIGVIPNPSIPQTGGFEVAPALLMGSAVGLAAVGWKKRNPKI